MAAPDRPARSRRRWPVLVGVLLALIVGVGAWLVLRIVPIGTGIAAKTVCSDVFVAGRDPGQEFLEQEVPQASFVSVSVDEAGRSATASAFGLAAKTAVYRPGLGCALVLGDATADTLRAEALPKLAPTVVDAPWPQGDGEDPRPDPAGLDRAALEAAIDEVFDAGTHPEWHSRAVVVVHRGRLLAERYAPGFDADTPQLGWSMTKSVTAALVGILAHRDGLDVHAPVAFDEWSKPDDPRAAITWDHMLRMSTGLDWQESYGLRSDVTVMLFDTDDAAALPLHRELAHDVDTHWAYSSGTTNLIQLALRRRFDDDAAYHRFPREALFSRIGMDSATMETDPSGTFVGSSYMYATPRDWARFGLLFLRGGDWFGERIFDAEWVTRTTTPTPTDPSRGYGAQWWLNAAEEPTDRSFPSLPSDAYFASGHQGQMVLVVPSREAVIVRMGMTNGPAWDRDTFAAAVLAALPE